MDARTLHCPACGAAAPAAARECPYCTARLATVACPSCFGLVFAGHRHCEHCGALTDRGSATPTTLRCPAGCGALGAVTVGETTLHECARCSGIWLDVATFERVRSERERQAAVLEYPTVARVERSGTLGPVRYRPCAECGSIMNRINFARSSGVIVDACKAHGFWFDADELRRVVEFIRGGGLEVAREREALQASEELRLLRLKQSIATGQPIARELDDRNEPSATGLLASVVSKLLGG
jgi:Zn-finger nucleic acid-binding protein